MVKVPFYKYIDILDPTDKLGEIERKGKKENKYSWSILVEEIKKNVIPNVFIDGFISKINENIKFSDFYYISNNEHIDNLMEKKNVENSDYLFNLQKYILLCSLEDKDFYLCQKDRIKKEMEMVTMIHSKLMNNKNNEKLKKLIFKYINIFEKRKALIKLINKKTKYYTHDDDLIINTHSEKDIKITVDYIKDNTIIYTKVKLPKLIKIKEINDNLPVYLTNKNNDYYVIYNYLKYKKGNFFKENNYNKLVIQKLLLNNIRIIKFYNYIYYFDMWKKINISYYTKWSLSTLRIQECLRHIYSIIIIKLKYKLLLYNEKRMLSIIIHMNPKK